MWNRGQWSDTELLKDVDVLVPSQEFVLDEPFEAGIDWWLPTTKRVRAWSDGSYTEKDETWFSNGNGVALHFGAVFPRTLEPGLYLPNSKFLESALEHELVHGFKHPQRVEGETLDHLQERIAGITCSDLSDEVFEFFGGFDRVLRFYDEEEDPTDVLRLSRLDFDTISAINSGRFVEG